MPAGFMWWLLGIHNTPPETAVVPPTLADFSMRMTLAPACCAASAATRPAPPEPTTSTSVSNVGFCLRNHMTCLLPWPYCSFSATRRVLAGDVATDEPAEIRNATLITGADVERRGGVAD